MQITRKNSPIWVFAKVNAGFSAFSKLGAGNAPPERLRWALIRGITTVSSVFHRPASLSELSHEAMEVPVPFSFLLQVHEGPSVF